MSIPTLDAWHFLATDYAQLLAEFSAAVIPADDTGDGLLCGIEQRGDHLVIHAAACRNEWERELVVRATLARWYGADTTDWPVELEYVDRRQR